MVKYTAIEKLNVLLAIIKSSPFFLTCFIVGLFIISFVALDFKTTKKVRGKLMLLCLVATIGFIIYKYYNYLLSISDNLVEEIFMALYFPNLAVYSIIILITNICLFSSLINKKTKNSYKVANIFSCVLIDFLFILILETIIKNKIDVYETLTVYSNKELLILLELSTCVFLAWLFVVMFLNLVNMTVKKEKVEEKVKENILYEAPSFNKYVYNEDAKVIPEVANDYTNIFEPTMINIEPVQLEENKPLESNIQFEEITQIEEVEPLEMNLQIEQPVYVEEIRPEIMEVKHEDPIVEVKPIEIPVVLEVKEEEKPVKVQKEKRSFTSLFTKKNIEVKEETFRVPLFDTLNDDAIMNCLVPVNKDKIIPSKSETAINIEKQELINNLNSNSDECRMLTEYLLKQG